MEDLSIETIEVCGQVSLCSKGDIVHYYDIHITLPESSSYL